MKKIFLFFTFICFAGIMNAQTSSNSVKTQKNELPTNEELVEYFKETEYPYPMSEYYKSFIHEFDSYITAPKLDLEQSESFKQLCNHFLKILSAEELEPNIVEKIHFKLFRDEITYHNIKCKLDNKIHLFLITGAGRVIHQSDNCDACKNIKTKRTQLKKQITEYIDYLKKKYGNLEKAHDELNIPYNVKERKRLIEQARIDSIRAVKIELEKANQALKKRKTDSINARVDSLKSIYNLVAKDGYVCHYLIQAGKNKINIGGDDLKMWGSQDAGSIGKIFVYDTNDSVFVSTYPDFFLNEIEKAKYNYIYDYRDYYSNNSKNKEAKLLLYKFPKSQKIVIRRNTVNDNKTKVYEHKPRK